MSSKGVIVNVGVEFDENWQRMLAAIERFNRLTEGKSAVESEGAMALAATAALAAGSTRRVTRRSLFRFWKGASD